MYSIDEIERLDEIIDQFKDAGRDSILIALCWQQGFRIAALAEQHLNHYIQESQDWESLSDATKTNIYERRQAVDTKLAEASGLYAHFRAKTHPKDVDMLPTPKTVFEFLQKPNQRSEKDLKDLAEAFETSPEKLREQIELTNQVNQERLAAYEDEIVATLTEYLDPDAEFNDVQDVTMLQILRKMHSKAEDYAERITALYRAGLTQYSTNFLVTLAGQKKLLEATANDLDTKIGEVEKIVDASNPPFNEIH